MEGLEFYVFEDELWCKTTSGKNILVDETKTELVKYMLEKNTQQISWCLFCIGNDIPKQFS